MENLGLIVFTGLIIGVVVLVLVSGIKEKNKSNFKEE